MINSDISIEDGGEFNVIKTENHCLYHAIEDQLKRKNHKKRKQLKLYKFGT